MLAAHGPGTRHDLPPACTTWKSILDSTLQEHLQSSPLGLLPIRGDFDGHCCGGKLRDHDTTVAELNEASPPPNYLSHSASSSSSIALSQPPSLILPSPSCPARPYRQHEILLIFGRCCSTCGCRDSTRPARRCQRCRRPEGVCSARQRGQQGGLA